MKRKPYCCVRWTWHIMEVEKGCNSLLLPWLYIKEEVRVVHTQLGFLLKKKKGGGNQRTHAIQIDWLLPCRGADYLKNSGNQLTPVWAEAKPEAKHSWGDFTNESLN